ncbi:MAG: hypothetical protein J0L99_18130 [Chitinophagales bacterium]|nr:hypothetical protein [Chitinophagales bacterium]
METLELKNDLLRMVAETNDPLILKQLIALFATLKSEGDWWDLLNEDDKQKIEQGQIAKEKGDLFSNEAVRIQAQAILQN